MTPCERIDNILKSRNMSRRKLAIQAGIAPSSLQSAMERNGTLSLDMLFPISDILNVSVQFLAEGADSSYASDEELEEYEKSYSDYKPNKEKSIARIKITLALEKLNEEGHRKAVERVEELTEIPRYRAETAPQSTQVPKEGKDTTPPPDAPKTPPEGK